MLARLTPVLLLGTVLVSACGDDDEGGVAVETYAQSVCDALTSFQSDVAEGQADLQAGLDPGASPSDAQAALGRFLDGASAAAGDFAGAVDKAGTPDTENGEEAATKLREAAGAVRDGLEKARGEVDDLPTDDPAAFVEATRALGADIESSFGSDPLEDIDAPELEAAFEATTCGGE